MQDPKDPGTEDWVGNGCHKHIWFSHAKQVWIWVAWVGSMDWSKNSYSGTEEKLSDAHAKADAAIERLCIQLENK